MMGAYYGDSTISIGANEENPNGFWERRDVRDLNDELLFSINCDWDTISSLDISLIPKDIVAQFNKSAKKIVAKLNGHPVWMIKEPRMCLLFPLWKPLFNNPVCIHIYRNPLEVAKSLKTRNQIPLQTGLALWEKYLISAVNNTKGMVNIFVSHQQMMSNAVAFTHKLHSQLQNCSENNLSLPSDQSIETVIDIDLYNNKETSATLESYLNSSQRKLYKALQTSDFSGLGKDVETCQSTKDILEEFDSHLYSPKTENLQKHNNELKKINDTLHKEVASKRTEINNILKSLKLGESALRDKQSQVKTYKHEAMKLDVLVSRFIHGNDQLLTSNSWIIGKSIVSLKQRLLGRSFIPAAENYLKSVSKDYSDWRESSQLANDNYIAKERVPPKLVKPFPSVDIIVCVHNALDDVKECLNSVIKNTPQEYTLIIVNDGSDEETSRYLDQFSLEYTHSVLLVNSEATGYTRAANKGLVETDAEYVVCLNSDTIVPRLWLNNLIECGESDPTIGIIGTLSNAASWQSIPERFDNHGDWAINELPTGFDLNQMAEMVYQLSERNFPRVDFVNGFCFAIKRSVISSIGLLDEESFPKGYGEENDYCLRAIDAGFQLAIADHGYVFHAKSKSYSHETRKTLSKEGSHALKEKHGSKRIKAGVEKLKDSPELSLIRNSLKNYLADKPAHIPEKKHQLNILFVMPVKGGSGGAHSVVQEVMGMRALGTNAKIATLTKYTEGFQNNYPSLFDSGEYFMFFANLPELFRASEQFDVIVATLWSSPAMIAPIVKRNPNLVSAYYIQDYEPWFFEEGSSLWQGAYDSYTCVENMALFAKTDWLRKTVENKHSRKVNKVTPSLDTDVYYHVDNTSNDTRKIRISAMIRPNTPRRNPWKTLEILKATKEHFGNTVEIIIFGCDMEVLEDFRVEQSPSTSLDFDFTHHGMLVREQVAEILRSSDIFIDFSTYQAFGRTGLEAMACNCATILPIKGGTDEYALHGENSCLVDTSSVDAMTKALHLMISDDKLRSKYQVEGLLTASRYSIKHAVLSELSFFREIKEAQEIKLRRNLAATTPKASSVIKVAIWPCSMKLTNVPTGSAYIRLIQPIFHENNKSSLKPTIIHSVEDLKNISADICIVQRNAVKLEKQADELIEHCNDYEIRLVHEIDDDLFNIPEDESLPLPLHEIHALDIISRNATCIVTSTQELQNIFKYRNDNVICIPTAIDESIWFNSDSANAHHDTDEDHIKVLYMGTRTHHRDIDLLRNAWHKIEDEYKDRVSLHIIGVTDGNTFDFGEVIQIPETFNYPNFVQWLRQTDTWDIGVIPLREKDFNLKKSNIKFLDYAALGLSIICSDLAPYKGIAKHNENALMVNNSTDEWYSAIKTLIDDSVLRKRLAKSSQEDVIKRFCLQEKSENWTNILRNVMKQGLYNTEDD
jgi:GT2 family glycosyltransferase/glycosyltransferase involved in cell wall biosynthesis